MAQIITNPWFLIPPSGGVTTIPLTDRNQEYNILAGDEAIEVTITVDATFASSGTPKEGMRVIFNYGGGVVYDGGTVTIFGYTMSEAEALAKYMIFCDYTVSTWVVRLFFLAGDTIHAPIDGKYVQDGTMDGNKLITNSVPLSKLEAAGGQGDLIRAGTAGAYETFVAKTSGYIVIGDGTNAISVPVSGDITIDETGAVTIGDDAVTGAKIASQTITSDNLVADLLVDTKIIPVSFESGETGAFAKIKMKGNGTITDIYAVALKTIAGTDAATITPKNNAGTSMTVTTPISFAASDAAGTAYDSAITGNNTYVDGDIILLTTAKTTAGGKALVTLSVLKA
jgi:hypothetical protein